MIDRLREIQRERERDRQKPSRTNTKAKETKKQSYKHRGFDQHRPKETLTQCLISTRKEKDSKKHRQKVMLAQGHIEIKSQT